MFPFSNERWFIKRTSNRNVVADFELKGYEIVVESTKFQDKHIYRKQFMANGETITLEVKFKRKTDKIWKWHELHIFPLKKLPLWNEKNRGLKCFPICLKYLKLSKSKLIGMEFACSKWAKYSQVLSIFRPLFIDQKTIYPMYIYTWNIECWFEKSILNFTYRIEMANSDLV